MGLISGTLGGLLGVGGGSLIVPSLVFLLAFNQHKGHGTSLLVALLMSISGVVTYYLNGHIDFKLALEIAIGGVIGAVIGAKIANAIKAKALRRVFSIFLIVMGLRMVLYGFFSPSSPAVHSAFTDNLALEALIVIGTGVITGMLSALLGVGGGMVMVPAMVILLCVPQKMAQGISLAVMVPTSFTGMLMHSKSGNVDFTVGKWVGLGAVIGALIGASIADSLNSTILMIAFGAFLFIMAVLMALKK